MVKLGDMTLIMEEGSMKLPIIVCSIQPLLPEFIHMGSAVCAMQRPSTVCGCFVLFLRNLFAISVAAETTFILHSGIPAIMHVFNLKIATEIISYHGFDGIFHHRNWRAKVSYGVDINQ